MLIPHHLVTHPPSLLPRQVLLLTTFFAKGHFLVFSPLNVIKLQSRHFSDVISGMPIKFLLQKCSLILIHLDKNMWCKINVKFTCTVATLCWNHKQKGSAVILGYFVVRLSRMYHVLATVFAILGIARCGALKVQIHIKIVTFNSASEFIYRDIRGITILPGLKGCRWECKDKEKRTHVV